MYANTAGHRAVKLAKPAGRRESSRLKLFSAHETLSIIKKVTTAQMGGTSLAHQAASTKAFLGQAFGIAATQIEAIGLEGSADKQMCAQIPETYRSNCEKTNRRLEILIYSE